MKNITKKELKKAIELLDGAIKAFSQPPNSELHNHQGICWYVAGILGDDKAYKYPINTDRKYIRLICIILNVKSIRETKEFIFGGGTTQMSVYEDLPNLKYERRNFCIKRKAELELQLKDKEK